MSNLDIAFFSYNQHQDLLVTGLKQLVKHVPNFNNLILVWDDYVRDRPVDFDQVEQEVGHKLKVVKHTDLDPWPKAISEWGWVKQQIVKLRCSDYSDAEYVWIVDGDVLIIDDPELFYQGKPVLRYDDEAVPNPAYRKFIQRYFGIDRFEHFWVGSACLFDTAVCREILQTCVNRNGKTLAECVAESNDKETKEFLISEFDLYGNFCYTNHSDKFYITKKNWNYAPSRTGLKQPIQIMWNRFNKDLSIAKKIACTKEIK